MKLVLLSGYLLPVEQGVETLEQFTGKLAKEINIVVINEAAKVQPGDIRWLIGGFEEITKTFGEITLCDLQALKLDEIEEKLNQADVIWCFGGSPDYLKIIFDQSKFSELLPKFLKTKVWVGSSAGSCIMGKRFTMPSDIAIYGGGEIRYDTKNYLEMVDACLYPHMHSSYVTENAFNLCLEESKTVNYPLYALSDDSALIVDDEKIYLIGKNAQKLVNGVVTEEV